MAVEARHMSLFPQEIVTYRDLVNSNQANAYGYNPIQMNYGAPLKETMADTFLPVNQSLVSDAFQAKKSMKAESGVTHNLPIAPRKRSRDTMNQKSDFSSVGEEIFSLQIQQQQLEMDQMIAQHTKKIRLELEERQKQHARLLVAAMGEGAIKKLKEKDEQIQKMGKLNFALQERVKSLYIETQLWKDVAQSNEATALSLRYNLEQVLAHVSNAENLPAGGAAEEAESCCGSNDYDGVAEQRVVAEEGVRCGGDRMCKKCGEGESCVLLLPCRHLCLCNRCGTRLPSTCPVCNSSMNATLHVNMS